MVRQTVNMPEEMNEDIEARLSYGDSKSAFIRNAIKLRIEVDSAIGDIDEDDYEERIQQVAELLSED